MSTLNRREFAFAAGAVAAAFATQVVAQRDPRKIPPEDAGKLHGEALNRGKGALQGAPAASESGLYALVDELLKHKLISKDDAASLKEMIKGIHKGEGVDDIETAINKALERKAGELTTAIVRIAKNSLDWAKERLKDINPRKLRYVIAHDTSGALEGAAAGATLGAAFAWLGVGAGAIVGAVIGSSATSLIAVDEYKEK